MHDTDAKVYEISVLQPVAMLLDHTRLMGNLCLA